MAVWSTPRYVVDVTKSVLGLIARGTAATVTTIAMSSTSVWVTITSGVSAKDAGSASASGSTTRDFGWRH